MRSMKKVGLLLIACLLMAGLIYGIVWIGDKPVSAEISQEAKGQFVRLEDGGKKLVASYEGMEKTYPVADNVWVYRNSQKAGMSDLQKGDTLEIILNNKSQAAYIKAASAAAAAPAPEPAANTPAASPAEAQPVTPPTGQAAVTTPPSSPAPAAPASPPAQQPSPQAVKAPANVGWPWERLSIELKSRELMLKVKQEQTDKNAEADIYVQTKDRAVVHLNGAEAEKVLRLMLQGLPQDRAAWEQALKQRLAAEFQLKDKSPDWKVDIRWKDDAKTIVIPAAAEKPQTSSQPQPQPKSKGFEKEKEHGSEKDKGKEKGKDKSRGSHDDDDHDDD